MGTPQVYSTVWNDQGQLPGAEGKTIPWDPHAPGPAPIEASPTDENNLIIENQANPGKTPLETEIDKIQAHNDVAANVLAQKNRKRKQSSMELPFDPTIEEGTVYQLSGFAQNFDGKWLVTEVNFQFSGKGGSRMTLEFVQCLPRPTTPTQPSDPSALLHDKDINSIKPKPANVPNLSTSPEEMLPNWMNNFGSLNEDQQDLHTDNAGPAG